jgi:hypothetical protein
MAWARTVAVVVPSPATSRGLGSDFLDHLGAHVLELVLDFDFLGHGDAVLGDDRRAEGFFNQHIAALGAQGYLDGIGQGVDAPLSMASRALAPYFNCFADISLSPSFC